MSSPCVLGRSRGRVAPLLYQLTGLVHPYEHHLGVTCSEAIQFQLPPALRQRIVDDQVAVRPQLVAPPDDHLPVDQPLVDSKEDDGHVLNPWRGAGLWRCVPGR